MKQFLLGMFLLIAVGVCAQNSNQSVNRSAKAIDDTASFPYWVNMMQDPSANFNATVSAFEKYWAGRPQQKGDGYKVFRRWQAHWESRLLPDGRRMVGDEIYQASIGRITPSIEYSTGKWTSLGPNKTLRWRNGNLNGVGRISAIGFHPTDTNILYIGAPKGGFWKSTTGGNSWSTTTDQLPTLGVSAIAVDPTNPSVILIGTGDRDAGDSQGMGVFKSIDGGQTFTPSNTGMGNVTVGKLYFVPGIANMLIAATNSGLYKSTDGGATWTKKSIFSQPAKDLAMKPNNIGVWYTAVNGSFYRSVDTGNTWQLIRTGLPTTNLQRGAIAVTPANPNYVYFLISNTNSGFLGMWRSTDSATTFTQRSSTPNIMDWNCLGTGTSGQGWYDLSVSADPTNPEIVHTGGVNVFYSVDGGLTWTISGHWVGGPGNCNSSYLHADVHVLEYHPLTKRLYAGTDGGIFNLTPEGQVWNNLSDGLVISQSYKIGSSRTEPYLVMNGYQDNGSGLINDTVWANVMGGDGMDCAIDYNDPNYMYGEIYYGDMSRSTDYGYSFTRIAGNGKNGITEAGDWVTPYTLHQRDPNRMFIGMRNVWRSDNVKAGDPNTIVWNRISSLSSTGPTIKTIEHSGVDPNLLFFASSSAFYRSQNASATPATTVTFTNMTSSLPTAGTGRVTDILCHPRQSNIVYILKDNKVYKSGDQGTTWADISGTLPNVPMNSLCFDSTVFEGLYLGTDAGVYYKDTTLSDWVLFSDGLPLNSEVSELEIYYHPTMRVKSRLRAGTYGRGLWESPLYTRPTLRPAANFSVDDTTGCDGYAFAFEDLTNNGPTSWTWSFSPATVNFVQGTNNRSQNPLVEFVNPGYYTVTLISGNAVGFDTIVKTNYVNVGAGVLNTPFLIDFDATTAGFTQYKNEHFDWISRAGRTPSVGTGPIGDHTSGTGNYYYVEASSPNYPKKKAVMRSYCFDISAMQRPYLEFWYSNFGTDVGQVDVEISVAGKGWTNIWTVKGNTGQPWKKAEINLSRFKGKVKIRFIGTTSFFWSGDMAVDDIKVYDRPQTFDLGMMNILRPSGTLCSSSGDSIEVQLKNFGTEKVGGYQISYQIDANTVVNQTITDSISGGDTVRLVFAVPGIFAGNALHSLKTQVSLTNDQNSSNNGFEKAISSSIKPSDPVISAVQTVCKGDSVNLSVTTNGDSVYWYSTATTTTALKQGFTYLVNNLQKDSTLYVQAFNTGRQVLGPDSSVSPGGYVANPSDSGLNFNVTARPGITLESVDVYSQTTGFITVNLVRSGTVLNTATFNITTAGKNILPVNFYVPRNTGYQLMLDTGNCGVYRNLMGAFYNYDLPGVATITGSTGDNNQYYYFYNWKIKYNACSSNRIKVLLKAVAKPTITVFPSNPVITRGDTVQLRASGAKLYKWTPYVALNTDTGSMVVANPTNTLVYTVSATDSNGCPGITTTTVTVNPNSIKEIQFGFGKVQVYPNPASEVLNLKFNTIYSSYVRLRISDASGKTVWQANLTGVLSGEERAISLPILADGIYMLEVNNEGRSGSSQIIIQNSNR